jgi:capsid portal protein
MSAVLQDADDMYKNDGQKLVTRYGVDEKEAMASWWNVLKVMDKELKKQGKIAEAKIVSDVMKKAVEPAYNYYKVDAQKVSEKAAIMTGLLVFYVVYTMWWGFAIFYMFDGIGLTMKKAKVKKEV